MKFFIKLSQNAAIALATWWTVAWYYQKEIARAALINRGKDEWYFGDLLLEPYWFPLCVTVMIIAYVTMSRSRR